jgi:hypothetical protein
MIELKVKLDMENWLGLNTNSRGVNKNQYKWVWDQFFVKSKF